MGSRGDDPPLEYSLNESHVVEIRDVMRDVMRESTRRKGLVISDDRKIFGATNGRR